MELRDDLMILQTSFERQISQNMPQHKTSQHHHSPRVHSTLHVHKLELSPFIYTGRTIANERHPERNEDSILIDMQTGLIGVFDGVGGSAAGEIASRTAAKATRQAWKRTLRQHQKRRHLRTMLEQCNHIDLCT